MRFLFISILCALSLIASRQAKARPAKIGETVDLRSGPGASFPSVVAIPALAVVEVGPCRAAWCRVSYAGSAGFVARPALAFLPARPVEAPMLPPLGGRVWRREIPPLYDPYDSAGPWYTGPWTYEGTTVVQWRYGFPGGHVPWHRNAIWRPGFGWF